MCKFSEKMVCASQICLLLHNKRKNRMPEERISDTTAELLLREARRINTPDFIPHDPVSFPRMYSDRRDVEIVSLLVSHISWGKREMILRADG